MATSNPTPAAAEASSGLDAAQNIICALYGKVRDGTISPHAAKAITADCDKITKARKLSQQRKGRRSRHIDPDIDATAIHEAGHAVLQVILQLGVRSVTIVPNSEAGILGVSATGGDYGGAAEKTGDKDDDTFNLRLYAEDAFLLRHAIADYAGVEAVQQLRPAYPSPGAGAEHDFRQADDRVKTITGDDESIDLYLKLAKRRCVLLVEHYRLEIEAVAAGLLSAGTLSGETVQAMVFASLDARRGRLMRW